MLTTFIPVGASCEAPSGIVVSSSKNPAEVHALLAACEAWFMGQATPGMGIPPAEAVSRDGDAPLAVTSSQGSAVAAQRRAMVLEYLKVGGRAVFAIRVPRNSSFLNLNPSSAPVQSGFSRPLIACSCSA